jgi:hypothetical protein
VCVKNFDASFGGATDLRLVTARASPPAPGISRLGKESGIRSRLRRHNQRKPGWTYFSFFEVHDNITGDEIRELEALLLQIFQHDSRVALSNVQTGSRKFRQVRKREQWKK